MYASAIVTTVPFPVVSTGDLNADRVSTVPTVIHEVGFPVKMNRQAVSHLNPISLSFDELDPVQAKKNTGHAQTSAAVLIAITRSHVNPEIIFTRRADHLNSHSGQVSFPGGRWEPGDADLGMTALRESYEEIALAPERVELKGCLGSRRSINGLGVQPYVGLVPRDIVLKANPNEIADIFKVPLAFFADTRPSRIDNLSRGGGRQRVPAWDFEGFDIWGLTAVFTRDLLARFGVQVDLKGQESVGHDRS